MRKLILVMVIVSMTGFNVSAQTISAGGGYVYGTGVKQSGVNFGASCYLSYRLLLTGDVNYFFPFNRSLESGESYDNRYELNFIAKYRRFVNNRLYLYPMAGIGWVLEREKTVELNGTNTDRSAEAGIVLGVGAAYQLNKIVPFCELRHTVSYLPGTSIVIGVAVKDVLR